MGFLNPRRPLPPLSPKVTLAARAIHPELPGIVTAELLKVSKDPYKTEELGQMLMFTQVTEIKVIYNCIARKLYTEGILIDTYRYRYK